MMEPALAAPFDLSILVPGSAESVARGCICPSTVEEAYTLDVVFCCGGHYFDPWCPVHRWAVLAETQRMFGRPQ